MPVALLLAAALLFTPADASAAEAAASTSEVGGLGASPDEGGSSPRAQRLRRAHRWLMVGTEVALIATAGLGLVTAINTPTAFGDGRCATGDPLLGDWGCQYLSIGHGMVGVASVTLYTASGVLDLVSAGPPRPPGRARALRILGGIHLAGMVLQPLLGMMAAWPGLFGLAPAIHDEAPGRALRTVHVFVGVVTVLAYSTALVLEF
ncbi:hypothetical protein L6R50_06770 [Myxococcota bacterium]|nr:hypothetical protein [Myxococcota bacterium]